VVVFTLGIYLPALDGPFLWDDVQLILDSPRVAEIQPLRAYWGSSFWTRGDTEPVGRNYYRPLSIFSLALDHRVHGLNPGGYHLTNCVLHGACTLLLFLLLRRRKLPTTQAGLLTLAWACAPRLTEAAAWISGRTDVLATFFVLLALFCSGRDRLAWRCVAAASALLGLFAKEVALAGVCGVALWEAYPWRGLSWRDRFKRLLPIGIVTVGYFAARGWAMGFRLRENGLAAHERVISALEATGHYTWMIVDGWHPRVHIGHLGAVSLGYVVLGCVVLVSLGVLSWRLRKELVGPQLAMVAVLGVSLSLVLHLVPITVNVVAADRFLYLPLAALALCLAPCLARLPWKPATVGLGLLVASYVPVTFGRIRVWADEVEFWVTAFRQQTNHKAMSRLELGNVFARAGLQSYSLALYLDADTDDYPNYLLAQNNAGTRLLVLGHYSEGTAMLEDLVRRSPEIPKFHFSLALAYLTSERYDDADKQLDESLRLYPDSLSTRQLKEAITRLRAMEKPSESEAATVREKLERVNFYALSRRHKEALAWLLTAAESPDISLSQLTEGMFYVFDWGTPKQLTTLYQRYRARGGSAQPIIDNYEMRMERVRRLRELWPTLGSKQPSATGG
jgi:tetratricopeptide (TPR) repeat protein